METPGLRSLKQSFGFGGRNLCCTLSVYYSRWILVQIWYVTFLMMKFLGLLMGLQTFAVVSDSFKHTGVICRMVNGSNYENWSHLQFGPVRAHSVRTGANHGKPAIQGWFGMLGCEDEIYGRRSFWNQFEISVSNEPSLVSEGDYHQLLMG